MKKSNKTFRYIIAAILLYAGAKADAKLVPLLLLIYFIVHWF